MINETDKDYIEKYALHLLNRIIVECKCTTPEVFGIDERFELEGELQAEIFNFLQNWGVDTFHQQGS